MVKIFIVMLLGLGACDCEVEGTIAVVDSISLEPIDSVIVTQSGESTTELMTNAEGEFDYFERVGGAKCPDLRFSLQREGYRDTTINLELITDEVRLNRL